PSPDHRHVLAVAAYRLTALAASVSRFVRVEFVRRAFCMRRLSTLARDLALFAAIHRRETTIAAPTAVLHVAARLDRRVALAFEAKKTNAGATSSGCPGRSIGVAAPCFAASFAFLSATFNGVHIGPGATQLTRICFSTRLCASDFVKAWIAPLVAA